MLARNDQIVLLGFVPALVVQYLMNRDANTQLPDKQSFKSVVMFADISGFTNLTETLSKIGPEGAELIAFAINRYMELLVSAISKSGGDIFKFAGDAMIVVWPPSRKENRVEQYEELKTICRQAIQSALDIQAKLDNTTILEDIKLSVKIGFGIGDISIIYVGGVFGRSEYLATGDPLTQAFQSEHQASCGGQIIVSRQVFDMIQDYFIFEKNDSLKEGFHQVIKLISNCKVRLKAEALMIKNNIGNFAAIKNQILTFIPAAVLPYFELEQEKWSSELRVLSILFINLGIDLSDAHSQEGLNRIQSVIEIVQKCVYIHEGSLNKLLMDDKGSTLIVCFGLPPLMHQDDAIRAILAAQLLISQLAKVNCRCSIGIATGTVFAGVVGTSGSRREYSVLGDSVNLAARLMQTALVQKKMLLVCEQTAKNSQHKIICQFYKDVEMKGKSGLIPVFEITNNEEPRIRTHYHTIPNTKKEYTDFDKRVTLSGVYQGLIGVQPKMQRIMELIIQFLQLDQEGKIHQEDMDTERDFLLIKGGYGIGKSFLMRSILNQIREEWSQQYKYQEKVLIIESSLNSIERVQKMNGFRKVIQRIYWIINSKLLQQQDILPQICSGQTLQLMEEILGFREKDIVAEFPSPPQEQNKIFEKSVAAAVIKLFELYFEIKLPIQKKTFQIKPHKLSISQNLQEDQDESGNSDDIPELQQSLDISMDKQFQLEQTVAPIIICLDDLQYYDQFSFYLVKTIIKKFSRIMVIGISRDNFWEIPIFSRKDSNSAPNKQQEIIYDKGIESILKQYTVTPQEVIIKGFHLIYQNTNDQKKLLSIYFGFNKFIKEQVAAMNKSMKLSVRNVKFDHLLLAQNKQQMMNLDFNNYVSYYIHLKTTGQPLLLINLINNFISSGYIIIDYETQEAIVTVDLQQIMTHDEWLQVPAPLAAVQMNSSIIDSLSCLNLLLLKFASVIGDIFDIQTLLKILPFKQFNSSRLLQALKLLTDRDIIEFMHDDDDNRFYRFVSPFMREVLYQRMTYSQRRNIHASVAEAMQLIPQPYDYDNQKELHKLEYHWKMAEYRVSVKQPKLPLKYSHKAKKSLIVKQIQMILEHNNDTKTPLRKGYLYKRSDKGVSWQYRYCVIDSEQMILYNNEEMIKITAVLPLKRISNIQPMFEQITNNQSVQFGLNVSVNGWTKEDKDQETKRTFIFAVDSEDELEEWVIFLEFAKAKAIYEDFVQNFGKIQLPINLTSESYDQILTMLMREIHKPKRALQIATMRKSSLNNQTPQIQKVIPVPSSSLISPLGKRFSVRFSTTSDMEDKMEAFALKDKLKEYIQKTLLLMIMHLITHIHEKDYVMLGQNGYYMKHKQKLFKLGLKQISSLADFQLSE